MDIFSQVVPDISVEIIRTAAFIGAGVCVGISSVSAGIGEGYTAGQTTLALMKQPKASDNLLRNMLVSQAVTETGAIFALVIALILIFGGFDKVAGGWYRTFSLLGAGIAMGLGSIGPGFGSGYAGGMASKATGRNPKFNTIISGNMLIGQALAQTGSIFALVTAMLLLYGVPNQPAGTIVGDVVLKGAAIVGAGLAIGLGTIGPNAGIGIVAGRVNEMIGRYPHKGSLLTRSMFLGSAVTESSVVFALVVSFLLIFQ